jgi:hypothetical protein
MFRNAHRLVAPALLSAVLLAGCTGNTDGTPGAASQQPTTSAPAGNPKSVTGDLVCEGQDCGADGKEVKTTPCSASAVDAIPAMPVKAGKLAKDVAVSGMLSLRKSTAEGAECDRLYWGKFDVAGDNKNPYTLDITVRDGDRGRYSEQLSEPGNPALGALTVGLKARKGQKVIVCITTPKVKVGNACLPETPVV